VQNSLDKLGCRTRAEAVRRLAELGTWSGVAADRAPWRPGLPDRGV